jgi:hypothetical protein
LAPLPGHCVAKTQPGLLECVADKFLANQKPRLTPKSYKREESIAVHLKAIFTGRLVDVTSSQVSGYVTARLGKVSKSSAQKKLNALKHLFRLVCGEWKLLPRLANPSLDVVAPKVSRRTDTAS